MRYLWLFRRRRRLQCFENFQLQAGCNSDFDGVSIHSLITTWNAFHGFDSITDYFILQVILNTCMIVAMSALLKIVEPVREKPVGIDNQLYHGREVAIRELTCPHCYEGMRFDERVCINCGKSILPVYANK